MSAPEKEPEVSQPEAPPAKQRLAPKLGLKGQIAFIMGLRQRCRMQDGEYAGSALLLLEPLDIERLDDLAEGLDTLLLDAAMKKNNHGWNRGSGR